jgi:hypothetical protein
LDIRIILEELIYTLLSKNYLSIFFLLEKRLIDLFMLFILIIWWIRILSTLTCKVAIRSEVLAGRTVLPAATSNMLLHAWQILILRIIFFSYDLSIFLMIVLIKVFFFILMNKLDLLHPVKLVLKTFNFFDPCYWCFFIPFFEKEFFISRIDLMNLLVKLFQKLLLNSFRCFYFPELFLFINFFL